MCLENIDPEKTKELQNSNENIIVYKLLNPDNTSIFNDYKWLEDKENISDREETELTEDEIEDDEIHKGFHFFLDKPKICSYYKKDENENQCQYRCPSRNRCQNLYLNPNPYLYKCCCRYRCTSKDPTNKVVKFSINPKDIVVVGIWDNLPNIVATKATWIEKIK